MVLTIPEIDETEFRWMLAKTIYPDCVEDIRAGRCPTCKKEIKEEDYRTDADRVEYARGGMCHACLDEVREDEGGDDDDD